MVLGIIIGRVNDRRFERLVKSHWLAVSTYAHSLASTPTIAEHAIQETFLRAWRYLDSFGGRGSFEGWLIRICRNCVYDLEAAEPPLDTASTAQISPSEPPNHRLHVVDAIARLPRLQREVIALCGLLDYDYETAARLLEVPIGTVRSRLSRARANLTIQLADQNPDHEPSSPKRDVA